MLRRLQGTTTNEQCWPSENANVCACALESFLRITVPECIASVLETTINIVVSCCVRLYAPRNKCQQLQTLLGYVTMWLVVSICMGLISQPRSHSGVVAWQQIVHAQCHDFFTFRHRPVKVGRNEIIQVTLQLLGKFAFGSFLSLQLLLYKRCKNIKSVWVDGTLRCKINGGEGSK